MPIPSDSSVHITLKNGDDVRVNDHVYCSPSWSIRDGTPYSVARIMEFLPAQDVPTFDSDGKRNEPFTRVRLAWYYRPGDVSDRPVADSRLLLAAIYSEVCDLGQLRGKCYVIHRDKISDLAGWKKRPDRFYFQRLFDPWIRKEFEVIQAESVRNIPPNTRDVLLSRYEYVVAEKEVVPDLTDTLRTCATCDNWCPPPETVQCDRCKQFFHMGCVSPPLVAKPSRGYGWTCAPCSREHEEEVDANNVQRHSTPLSAKAKSNAPASRSRGRPRKDRLQAEKEENMEIKHFKMWPFRYFGQYTVAEDTLDPDDLIFPRTATRVGPKYQVSALPTLGVETDSFKLARSTGDIEERGGDDTIEILSFVGSMSPREIAAVDRLVNHDILTKNESLRQSVDWLTEVVKRATDTWRAGRDVLTVDMKSPIRVQKWKVQDSRYTDTPWSDREIAAFEEAIATHGAELRAVYEEVGGRTVPEVVRFYGHWKNSRLGEENARINAARASGRDLPERPPSRTDPEEDEGSIAKEPSRNSTCGACRTAESDTWWKAPKGLLTDVLCDNCGISWRKYADLNVRPFREEGVSKNGSNGSKVGEKREGTPSAGPNAKRARTNSSVQSTPPPSNSNTPQMRCLACNKNAPISKVLRCKQCQFRVHPSAVGVSQVPPSNEGWVCELCENEKTLEASLTPYCLLCPRRKRDPKKKSLYPPPDNYLRACKPTEGQGWAHILCAVFVPEVEFSDASKLRTVEGISTIPSYRWMNKCTLCNQTGGAVVKCSDCPAEYHVSCAWKHGHKFGFEVQPVKSSRREATTCIDFKDSNGQMSPTVTCKGHPARRQTFGLCEVNEAGETALQVYCSHYKQVKTGNTHGLLRKAQRLDTVLSVEPTESDQGNTSPKCSRCETEYSPQFYPTPPSTPNGPSSDSSEPSWLCHRCHFKERPVNGAGRKHTGLNGINGILS